LRLGELLRQVARLRSPGWTAWPRPRESRWRRREPADPGAGGFVRQYVRADRGL